MTKIIGLELFVACVVRHLSIITWQFSPGDGVGGGKDIW